MPSTREDLEAVQAFLRSLLGDGAWEYGAMIVVVAMMTGQGGRMGRWVGGWLVGFDCGWVGGGVIGWWMAG